MAIGDVVRRRSRLRPVVGDSRKAISGGERGSPGRAVQAGIKGIELSMVTIVQSQLVSNRRKNMMLVLVF